MNLNRTIKFRAWSGEDMIFQGLYSGKMPIGDLYNSYSDYLMQFTGLTDKNDKEIYEGDLHLSEATVDGQPNKSYLPIVFENGAFWLDESFEKNGTCLTLLCEYDEPLNIQGNIHENPEHLIEVNRTKTD